MYLLSMCNSVYKSNHYMDCVKECAQLSMQRAVDSVKSTPEYTTNGEVPVYATGSCTWLLHGGYPPPPPVGNDGR